MLMFDGRILLNTDRTVYEQKHSSNITTEPQVTSSNDY